MNSNKVLQRLGFIRKDGEIAIATRILFYPQPGIGYIVAECPKVPVIPVFIVGMTNNYAREVYRNWFAPAEFPITVYYGATMYWDQNTNPQNIANDTLEQIENLATTHRKHLHA